MYFRDVIQSKSPSLPTFINNIHQIWTLLKQLSSGNIGTEELLKIDDETKEQMIATLHGGMDANENQQNLAEMNFEAWMRQLDAKVQL